MNDILQLFAGAVTLAGLKTLLVWLAVTGLVNLVGRRVQVEDFAKKHPRLNALFDFMNSAGFNWVKACSALAEFLRALLPEKLRNKIPTLLVLACLSLTSGCAGTFGAAKSYRLPRDDALSAQSDTKHCEALDNQRTTWGAIAKGAAILAGGSGVAALPVEGDDAKLGLAAGALAAGTVAVVSVYVSEQKGDAWVRECSE